MATNIIHQDSNYASNALELNAIKKENSLLCSLQTDIWLKKCRVCLDTKNNLLNVFNTDTTRLNPDLTIAEKINMCSNITKILIDDCFSKTICNDCNLMLNVAYRFKILCENSDKTMRLEVHDPLNDEIHQIKYEPLDVEKEIVKSEYAEASRLEPDNRDSLDETGLREAMDVCNLPIKNLCQKFKLLEKKFQCEECGYVCSIASNLKNHKSARHQVETPFPCLKCPKEFKNKYSLNGHMNMTHLVDPIVCESCGKTFKNPTLLGSHVRSVHRRESKKTYNCSYCQFRTTGNAALRRHESTHTRERSHHCTMCEKSFHNSTYLTRHIRECHDRIKPHKCDQCGKAFLTPDKLRRHSVAHTGLKPFICPHCTTCKYKWYKGLELHVKLHHPNEIILTEAKMYKDFMTAYNSSISN